MPNSAERAKILEMIDQGVINAEEGYQLLRALDSDESTPIEEEQPTRVDETHHQPPTPEEINQWKRWWLIPFWVGTGIVVLGAGLMYWAWQAAGFGFWFACAWFPFLLGVALLALAWSSQRSPWLHLRVHKPGDSPKKITISFPIPIRISAWGLRTFGRWIPNLDATGLDELILALNDSADQGAPFFIDVHEGEGGERVQVFIG
jgi:hypothetical protein